MASLVLVSVEDFQTERPCHAVETGELSQIVKTRKDVVEHHHDPALGQEPSRTQGSPMDEVVEVLEDSKADDERYQIARTPRDEVVCHQLCCHCRLAW
jgi:hypothetical protein